MNNPMDPDMLSSPPPRRRKWRILGGLVLLLVLLLGGGYVFLRNLAESDWQAAVAEAEQDDPQWRWDDLQARRRTFAEEENGALVILAARKLLPKPWPVWDVPLPASPLNSAEPPGRPEEQRRDPRQEEERLALQSSFSDLQPQHQLSERQLAALRVEVKRAAEALTEARKLMNLPGGRFAIKYTPDFSSTRLDEIQEARAVVNLLGYDVLLHAQEQDLAGALASCHALFNLGRCLDEELVLIVMLVRIACRSIAISRLERVLAQGEPEEADLARLQKVLEEDHTVPILLHAYRGERATSDMTMQNMESGQIGTARFTKGGISPWESLRLMVPGGMRQQRTAILRLNNRVVEMAKLPSEKIRIEAEQIVKEIPTSSVLANMMGQAHVKVANATLRSLAELRCALVMLAAERYRRVHQRWPESLMALTPDFLTQVPTDPYDGQPLRLRRLDDDLVIYSISSDAKDDGGKLSVRQTEGTDLGVRLWDVKHRRQPPLPPKPKEDVGPPP